MDTNIRKYNDAVIAGQFTKMNGKLLSYVLQRINTPTDAENIVQDTWLKLLESDREINEETFASLAFTVARNLVNDFLRHKYVVEDVHADLRQSIEMSDDYMESRVIADDLLLHEKLRVEYLPGQRRAIYNMSRFDELTVDEIARSMNLSVRTVENHLRLGRRDVRQYLAAIA